MKKVDQRFWENEGSKRSNSNKKRVQLDRKSRRKFVQNTSKWSNEINPTLGQIIAGA